MIELRKKANDLAQKFILADTHVDLPYRLKIKHFRLEREYLGIPVSTPKETLILNVQKRAAWMHPLCPFTFPRNIS